MKQYIIIFGNDVVSKHLTADVEERYLDLLPEMLKTATSYSVSVLHTRPYDFKPLVETHGIWETLKEVANVTLSPTGYKTFYIRVSHPDASNVMHIQARVKQDYSKEALTHLLGICTNYNIKISEKRFPARWKWSKRRDFHFVDGFVNLHSMVRKIRLYKVTTSHKWEEHEEVVKKVEFTISNLFTLDDVNFSESDIFGNKTFFHIGCKIDPDIRFDNARLFEELGCKLAKSGNLYLCGEWRFTKGENNNYTAENIVHKRVCRIITHKRLLK